MLLGPLWKWVGGSLLFLWLITAGALVAERIHAKKLQHQLTECTQGRAADRQAYQTAQTTASEQNKREVAEKELKQERLNADQVRTLNSRLSALRSELRSQAGTAEGAAGGPGASEADRAEGATSEARMCFPTSTILRGAENEERHDELISLVEQAMKILNEPSQN